MLQGSNLPKYQQDNERRIYAKKCVDYYNYNQKNWLYEKINNTITKSFTSKEYRRRARCEDLTRQIIDDISLLFQNPVNVNLENIEGKENEDLQDVLSDNLFNATMQQVNRFVNLLGDVAVVPAIREEKVCLDIITSDNIFILPDKNDPVKAKGIAYQVGRETKGWNVFKERTDIYHMWTKEGKFELYVSESGIVKKEVRLENVPSYDNEIPVVVFRNYKPVNHFFKPGDNPLVEANESINYSMTRLDLMRDYNTPLRVSQGLDKQEDLYSGVTVAINHSETEMGKFGDTKFINPNAPIQEETQTINYNKTNIAISNSLSKNSVTGETFTSGFHLEVSQQDKLNKNRQERPFYEQKIKKLIRYIMMTANNLSDYNFNTEQDVIVDFGEITFYKNKMDTAKLRTMQINNKTKSRIDFIMEDEQVNREQAIEIANRIDSETNKYSPKADFENRLNQAKEK